MSAIILKAANEFSVIFLGTSRSDNSIGDRVNYRYTCAILVACTIIVSSREFTMKRIQCWVPAFFTGNYEQYTNDVCWVRNTYYVADDSPIPDNLELRRQSSIRYYQWIPFILLFEAFCFLLPHIFWRSLCEASGIDIRDMVEAATNYKKSSSESHREQLMKFMVSILDQYVDDPRRQSDNRVTSWWKKCFLIFFPSSGRYMGDYLRNLFLFTKLLYVTNVLCQVFILSFLLDQPYSLMGLTILKYAYEGKGWNFHSRYFPKVTLCDFQIREPNALPLTHTYTVMCVLPINLFNQQIFTLLWFWYAIVIVCTVYDLLIWLYRIYFRRQLYLHERLKILPYENICQWPFDDLCRDHMAPSMNGKPKEADNPGRSMSETDDIYIPETSEEKVRYESRLYSVPQSYYDKKRTLFQFFDQEYLEADGHFILRIISTNASDFVSTKILHRLYNLCCQKRFRPFPVQTPQRPPIQTLYKYIIMPREDKKPKVNADAEGPDQSDETRQPVTTMSIPSTQARSGASDGETSQAVRQRTTQNSSNV